MRVQYNASNWHYFDDEDLAAIKECFDRGRVGTIGGAPAINALQDAFCKEFGSPYAYGVCNAMAGLHAGVAATGAGCGDEVIVDSLVGFGAAAVMFHNAMPVFADVRRDTWTMDVESLKSRISERTKGIIVTHLMGLIADMDEIMEVARENNLTVIEDCSHAIYSTYKGKYAGTIGDIGVFSFQESKQLSTGDGGMVLYKTPEHGEIIDAMVGFGTIPKRIATNYRMNEMTAAVGRVQLGRTPGYVEMCVNAAKLYYEAVEGLPLIRAQYNPPERFNSQHLWSATFEGDPGQEFTDFEALRKEKGVVSMFHYIGEVPYLHEVFSKPIGFGRGCPLSCPFRLRDAMFERGACPTAEDIMSRIILMYTGGDPEFHKKNAEGFRAAIEEFSG